MLMGEKQLEVEVKFAVEGLDPLRERVLAAGGTLKKPRVYERNVVFDRPDGELALSGRLLRLRRDEKAKLTFKGPAEEINTEVKVREEIETIVADHDQMEQILLKSGFVTAVIYEKYRETFQVGEVEIVLDEMPYGPFIELEGPEVDLRPLAETLGLDWQDRVNTNYLGLLAMLVEVKELPFEDLTFENFETTDVRIRDIL